jgi:hypothetical protein
MSTLAEGLEDLRQQDLTSGAAAVEPRGIDGELSTATTSASPQMVRSSSPSPPAATDVGAIRGLGEECVVVVVGGGSTGAR